MSCHHKIYHLAVVFAMTVTMAYAGPSLARDLLEANTNTPKVPNIDADIKLDGFLDEPAWNRALQLTLDYESEPGDNLPARVETRVYLFEDSETLYVAFVADDPNPEEIRAYLRERDALWNDDYVGILIDPFNDGRRAYGFFATPLGVQADISRNEDATDHDKYDDSWDAIWDAQGRIHEKGYTVEFAIPLSQLRFPNISGEQTWKIFAARAYPREEGFEFSNRPVDRDNNCRVCQYQDVRGFEIVAPTRDLEIVPTLTVIRSDVADENWTLLTGKPAFDGGVSVRWGVTPDVTASFALNPDFSQVEADVAQLDINQQFALEYPEKRPFFLQGSEYFSTQVKALFTRTIVDPRYGAKITGRRDGHTFGMFVAEDEATNLLIPGTYESSTAAIDSRSQSLAARYSYNFGPATAGALLTSRNSDGYKNRLGSIDGVWNISDQESLQLQYLHTETEYPDWVVAEFDQPTGLFSGSAAAFRYRHDGEDWTWFAMYRNYDKDFRADSGFVPNVGYDWQKGGFARKWWGDQDNWWNLIRLQAEWDVSHDSDGRLMARDFELRLSVNGAYSSEFSAEVSSGRELWKDVLYEKKRLNFEARIKPRSGLYLSAGGHVGDEVDYSNDRLADSLYFQPVVEWNINKRLYLSTDYTFSRLDSKSGSNIYVARLADVRLAWYFNVRSYLRLTLQQQDIRRNQAEYIETITPDYVSTGSQLLYSYKLNPQTVFFLGYADNHIDDYGLAHNVLTDRTFFMKIGYAWMPEASIFH